MKNKYMNVMLLSLAGLITVSANAANSKKDEISKKSVGCLINQFESLVQKNKMLLKLGAVVSMMDDDRDCEETETTNTSIDVNGKKYGETGNFTINKNLKNSKKQEGLNPKDAFIIHLKVFLKNNAVGAWAQEDCLTVMVQLLSFLDQKTDLLLEGGEKQLKNYLSSYSTKKLELLFKLLNFFVAPIDLIKHVEKILIEKLSTQFKFEKGDFDENCTEDDDIFFSEINFGEQSVVKNDHTFTLETENIWSGLTKMEFSPDGKTYAVGLGLKITLFDYLDNEIGSFLGKNATKSNQGFSFSPDGKLFTAFFWDEPADSVIFEVRDMQSGKTKEFTVGIPGNNGFLHPFPNKFIFSGDHTIAFMTHFQQSSTVHLFDFETGSVNDIDVKDQKIDDFFVNKERSVIILKLQNNVFKVLDLKTMKLGDALTPWDVDLLGTENMYSPHGTYVIKNVHRGNEVWINNQQNKQIKFSETPLKGYSPIFSSDEKYLVLSDEKGYGVRVFALDSGTLVFEIKGEYKKNHYAIGFTDDSRFFVTQSANSLFVWDTTKIDTTGKWYLVRTVDANIRSVYLGFETFGILENKSSYGSFEIGKNQSATFKTITLQTINFESIAQRLAFTMLKNAENEKRVIKTSVSSKLGQYIGVLPDDVLKYFINIGILVLVPEEKLDVQENLKIEEKIEFLDKK